MAGLADFHRDARGKFGGQTEARTKNFQDERIPGANQFQPTTNANTERLEPLRVFIVGHDAAHHGADARRQCVQPDERNGLCISCHNLNKIVFPAIQCKVYPPARARAVGRLRFVVGGLRWIFIVILILAFVRIRMTMRMRRI